MRKMDDNNEIWFGVDGKQIPSRKSFLIDVEDGIVPKTIWSYKEAGHNHEAKDELKRFFPENLFTTPKPERLLKLILNIGSRDNDVVLDFFVGSGTTAAVAHKMGRQYIGIEQMTYREVLPVERLKKVISGEQGGISKSVNWQGGGDFIYCELMEYNQAFMERIQAAKSSKQLLRIWRDMAEGSFLNWYVNPAIPEDAIKDFEELGKRENGMEKQKRLLAELLDKNQLYVNLSEIDDAQFKVGKEDKALNKAFYGEL
jgi:adenine-specific DNA-methyltransferase